jgi:nifR3 family TIM-barrel protein
MAGVSDAAYRTMARSGGAALAYTEMVSVAGMHYGSLKTWELVDPCDAEPDIAVQLFGRDVGQFREAVIGVQERLRDRLALIDVNMACPVPKVTRKGEGSALLADPDQAAAIIRACTEEADVPVTCKIRLGLTSDAIVAPEFASRMEDAGASAVAVHGRTRSQLYHGASDRSAIAEVVSAVGIPVIASGDAMDEKACVDILHETGAAAVFVARGSYGDPWVFSRALDRLSGREVVPPTTADRLGAFECHVRLLDATGGRMARARSLAGWYLKGLPRAGAMRDAAMRCLTLDDYLDLLDGIRSSLEGDL